MINKIGNFSFGHKIIKRLLPVVILLPSAKLYAQDRFEKQIEPCPTINIAEDMSVEHVQYNGSPVQQLVASLFDIDKSGEYDKDEADIFNNHEISLKEGKMGESDELVLTSKTTGNQIKFIYNDKDDLSNYVVEDGGFYCYMTTDDYELVLESSVFNCKNVIVDLVNNELTVDGMQNGYVSSAFTKNIITNSVVQEINLTSEESKVYLTLDKVHAKNNKPTKIAFNSSMLVLKDSDSSIQTK